MIGRLRHNNKKLKDNNKRLRDNNSRLRIRIVTLRRQRNNSKKRHRITVKELREKINRLQGLGPPPTVCALEAIVLTTYSVC